LPCPLPGCTHQFAVRQRPPGQYPTPPHNPSHTEPPGTILCSREVRNDIAAQAVLGVKLDATYSKAQILQMYAQVLYFGQGFYGLHDASCGYFNTPPRNLTWSQASLLVALPEAPSNYDLDTDPQLGAQLQAHVLNRLVAAGALTRAEADQITPNSWQLATRATTGTSSGC